MLPVDAEKDKQNVSDARNLAESLGMKHELFELKDAVSAYESLPLDKVALGNLTARLRMVEYRNRVTATMCYDKKAILDHFAIIDENRVMGVMDLKGVPEPYVFILERDGDRDLKQNF